MKLFKSDEAIGSEIGRLREAEQNRRYDRATVSAFFNGKPPMTDAEAASLGFTVNVNNLFGYTEIAAAKDQTFALYTKPTKLFSVELGAAPPSSRQKWEMESTKAVNEIILDSKRMKPAYEGVAGDGCLHGEGIFTWPDATDWRPRHLPLSKAMVPDDATLAVNELTHFGIDTSIGVGQACYYFRHECEGWNKANLRRMLKHLFDKEDKEGKVGRLLDEDNIEEIEHYRQTNSALDSRFSTAIPVTYFFQIDPHEAGCPVELRIAARYALDGSDKDKQKQAELFKQDAYFPSMGDCVSPFFMDCILGGEQTWHRVLGLGHLNYAINQAVEMLINRAMQGTMESSMTYWQATDAVSRDELQQVLMRHNGIIPEGITPIPNRVPADLNQLLAMIQFFRQQGSKNATGTTPNIGDKNDQLEVQAIAEQNQGNASKGARFSNWYDYLDVTFTEILARFVNPLIRPHDRGYSEIKKFQDRMQRKGIPLHYLQPHNTRVRATRIIGDGDRQKELQSAAYITSVMASLPPNAQQDAKRYTMAIMTDNHELAERWFPAIDKPDSSQLLRSSTEMTACMDFGAADVPPLNDDDVDEVHIQDGLKKMGAVVKKAQQFQKETFTADQMDGFMAMGAHTAAHIQKLEEMGKKDIAKGAWDALNGVVSMGQKMANNLKQQMESQQQTEMDPVKAAELQLKSRALDLQEGKSQFAREKFDRTQPLKENDLAHKQVMALEKDRREEKTTQHDIAAKDLELALAVAEPAPKNTE